MSAAGFCGGPITICIWAGTLLACSLLMLAYNLFTCRAAVRWGRTILKIGSASVITALIALPASLDEAAKYPPGSTDADPWYTPLGLSFIVMAIIGAKYRISLWWLKRKASGSK